MSTCRGCGASILWARTAAGRAIPLNAEAVLGFVVTGVDGERHATAKRFFTSHHATCPKADDFRKPKGNPPK